MDKHNHTKLSDDIINKTFVAVFGRPSPLDIDGVLEKIAFDIKLPVAVHDSTTGEQTWAESINPTRFITQENSDRREEWMMPKQMISSIDDIIEAWRKINFTTTERNFNSTNTFESDTIYDSANVIRSANCNSCKNILFCTISPHSARRIRLFVSEPTTPVTALIVTTLFVPIKFLVLFLSRIVLICMSACFVRTLRINVIVLLICNTIKKNILSLRLL